MNLTIDGEEALRMESQQQITLASNLINGTENIMRYTKGNCYETVLFVRHLLQRNNFRLFGASGLIMPTYLCRMGIEYWKYNQHIQTGSAVLFQRDYGDHRVFHAAISCGDTYIRGVNSCDLSPGWSEQINFSNFLHRQDNSTDVFTYDGNDIRVIVRY